VGTLSRLRIAAEPFDSPDAAALVALAEAELHRRYGPGPHDLVVPEAAAAADSDHGQDGPAGGGTLMSAERLHRPLTVAEFSPPGGTFLVARLGGEPVGCVGLRPVPGAAEVKRLFVVAEQRQRGIANALMTAVETAATGLGHRRLVLETGERQPEAVALYDSTGWTRIDSYFGTPRHELSVYFEKPLEDAQPEPGPSS